jgi:hypothetical protein
VACERALVVFGRHFRLHGWRVHTAIRALQLCSASGSQLAQQVLSVDPMPRMRITRFATEESGTTSSLGGDTDVADRRTSGPAVRGIVVGGPDHETQGQASMRPRGSQPIPAASGQVPARRATTGAKAST